MEPARRELGPGGFSRSRFFALRPRRPLGDFVVPPVPPGRLVPVVPILRGCVFPDHSLVQVLEFRVEAVRLAPASIWANRHQILTVVGWRVACGPSI